MLTHTAAGAQPAAAIIETDGLCKHFGAVRAVEELTMSIRAGEIFGFLGPNGAGKTTTIRTLLDFLHPTRGARGSSGSTATATAARSARGWATCPASSPTTGG